MNLKEKILEEINLDAKKLAIIEKLIYQSLIVRVMTLLGGEAKDEFDRLLMEKIDDEETVLNFLRIKIPDLDKLINEEIANFKKGGADFLKNIK